ncbi:FAA hydrolase family protein [Peribacillus saganii]|uniref:FAA hydrolase family protein n=1 Tax=Peribacillus saganii TaxID=2303992 RepID=A0A372LLZ1_9BACI|nr:fumarylacetoacetate hydrolase family protein [Peribacillus saganii]RFU68061.1 FAA hydrolase family protein [Peribacillus saganii]
MKIATVTYNRESHVALVDTENNRVLLLKSAAEASGQTERVPSTVIDAIEMGSAFLDMARQLQEWADSQENNAEFYVNQNDVTFESPIVRPRKNIFCVGKNYADHAIEMGSAADIPEHIMLFTKAPTTVIGDGASIPAHADVTSELDYEGELAVVIGRTGRGIQKEDALDYIFGYTILNDVTARDMQARHKQFFLGKSLDGTCPIGPYIVEKSLIPNPNELNIRTSVNGEVRQDSNTKHFIFPIEEIISTVSKGMTLEPGDIIATGTPAGVGKGLKPPKFLKAGDVIEITIEGLGKLVNEVQ